MGSRFRDSRTGSRRITSTTTMGRKHFVAGNWKQSASKGEIEGMIRMFKHDVMSKDTEVVVACPQAHLQWCCEHMAPGVAVAAQNCYVPEVNMESQVKLLQPRFKSGA